MKKQMARRSPNYRLVKIHRNYTVEEVTSLLEVHRNTVREWIRHGLPTLNDKRPILILGRVLADWLKDRRTMKKRPCQAGEIYCMRCRIPQKPAGDLYDYKFCTPKVITVEGICPSCHSMMYQRVNLTRFKQIREMLEIP